jgi:hypothetical protein
METEITQGQSWIGLPEKRQQTSDSGAAREVRRWLEDAWRHGEVLDDADGVLPSEPRRPVDRFFVEADTVV